MRALLAALTVFAGATPAPAEGTPPPSPTPPDTAVRVRVQQPTTGPAFGSGTVVASEGGKSLVVTNRHVVPREIVGLKVEHRETIRPAAWLGVNPVVDLALVEVPAPLSAARLATHRPRLAAKLTRYAFPRGNDLRAADGSAGGVVWADARTGAAVYATNAPAEPGESGGGVFDADGALVAVAWSDVGGAVQLADVRAFLRRAAPTRYPALRAALEAAGADDCPPAAPVPPPAAEDAARASSSPKVRVTLYTDPVKCGPYRRFGPVFEEWKARHPGVEWVVAPVDLGTFGHALPWVVVTAGGETRGEFTGAPAEAAVLALTR